MTIRLHSEMMKQIRKASRQVLIEFHFRANKKEIMLLLLSMNIHVDLLAESNLNLKKDFSTIMLNHV